MLDINRFRLYPFKQKSIKFLNNPNKEQYTIFFYPENTDFIDSYSLLNIQKIYVKKVLLTTSVFPKVLNTGSAIKPYRELTLLPITKINEKTDNVYIDLSRYLDALDSKFKKASYRRTVVSARIKQYLNGLRGQHIGRKKVFLYTVNLDLDLPTNIQYRRIYPILEMFREEEKFPFDYFLMNIISEGSSNYYLLTKDDNQLPFNKIRTLLRGIQSKKPNFVDQDESNIAATKTVDKLDFKPNQEPVDVIDVTKDNDIETDDSVTIDKNEEKLQQEKEIIKDVMSDYLENFSSKDRKNLINKKIDSDTAYTLATKSILYNISGDIKSVNKIVDNVPVEKRKYMFDRVKQELLKDVVKRDKPQNNSRDTLLSNVDINNITEKKDPSHILNKRKKDFTENFESDLKNSFKMLSKKDFPLSLVSMKKTPVPVDKGDLNPSLYDQYEIILKDDKNKKHKIQIQIPSLLDDGTFLINGKKKYLLFQIILDPIFFMKPGHAKLETLYATTTIYLKDRAKTRFYQILIGGYKLPLIILMAYHLGLDKTLKLFGIKNKLSETNDKGNFHLKLFDDKYLNFQIENNYQQYLVNPLIEYKEFLTSTNIFDKKTYDNLLIKLTGNRNSTWKISQVLDNIMEPVAVQVLKTKLLPFTFPQCMLYICQELEKGRVDDRNDISKQRIRSSEVFVHQIQKLILGSYTDYRERRLSGFNDAEYRLDVTEAVKKIVNSKLMADLENINPTEELSCFTRVKPIGEGGVPDANAITKQARNIHPTYYGNIDSMDTPESCLGFRTKIKTDLDNSTEICNLDTNDTTVWKDGSQYNVVGKINTNLPAVHIKFQNDEIICSKNHKFPVYDTLQQQEIVLTVEEISKDIKRYKLIKYTND